MQKHHYTLTSEEAHYYKTNQLFAYLISKTYFEINNNIALNRSDMI